MLLVPAIVGTVTWLGPRQLEFQHSTLRRRPLTSGAAARISRRGRQRIRASPSLDVHNRGIAQRRRFDSANLDSNVDPASYLAIDFTREMDPSTLSKRDHNRTSVPFSSASIPQTQSAAVVAPDSLLTPATTYTVNVGTAAL